MSAASQSTLRSEKKKKKKKKKAKKKKKNCCSLTSAASQDVLNTTAQELVCPISQDLPIDPVFAEDGFVYDRKCIKTWLEKKGTSPRTNQAMGKRLFEAVQIRNILEKMVRSGVVPKGMGKKLKKRVEDQDLASEMKSKAEAGDAAAMSKLGDIYAMGRAGFAEDALQAFKWYQKAANLDDMQATCRLGFAYEQGSGCDQSDVMAMYCYASAASKGHADAMVCLGEIFAGGLAGCPRDAVRAAHWFAAAARQNDDQGCLHLAKCYARGLGVDKNLDKARELLLQIDPMSKSARRMLDIIAEDDAAAREYFAKDWTNSDCSSSGSSSCSE